MVNQNPLSVLDASGFISLTPLPYPLSYLVLGITKNLNKLQLKMSKKINT